MLHWHGDLLDLPPGTERLASTHLCANQAFSLGNNILGDQFHLETDLANIEDWLIGHAAELAAANMNPNQLRWEAALNQAALAAAAAQVLEEWLTQIAD